MRTADGNGNDKDGPGGGGRKDDINLDAGVGGGGGGYHRTVLLLDDRAAAADDNARASPFLCLNRPKIRQAYRVYLVNN